MKVLFDTNVILDYFIQREPFYRASREVIFLSAEKKLEGIIGAGSIADIYYICRKEYQSKEKSLNLISDLLKLVTLVDTKAYDINNALSFKMSDFEDAIIAAAALREKADYIVTRNVKDYSKSPVPAIAPDEFLSMHFSKTV
jgi:predicted nucleic acid-binding protein